MLTGTDLKLRRAGAHIEEVDRMIQAWLDTDAFEIVPMTDEASGRTRATVRIVEPPPVELALVIGDAVHNLRTALDHIVYEAAETATGGSLTEREQGKLQFPVLPKRPSDFAEVIARYLPKVPPDVVAVIEDEQPYQWTRPSEVDGFKYRPIWQVNELDRIDKHRRLTLTTSALRHQGLSIPDGVAPESAFFHAEGAVRDGQVLVAYTGRDEGVTHLYDRCVVVGDGGRGVEGQPAGDMLRTLHQWVSYTVQRVRFALALP